MANINKPIYMVVSLGGLEIGEALKDALISSCTNKTVLSEMTGISRDRLAYVFVRKGKNILIEDDFLILRSNTLYKGRQKGGLRNRNMTGYNRN
jgi:hypothetical protein